MFIDQTNSQMEDPAQLPAFLPENLEGLSLDVLISGPDGLIAEFEFSEENGDQFEAFWQHCYARFGQLPSDNIVVAFRCPTPMKNPRSNRAFTKTSFIHVSAGRINRFTRAEAQGFLKGLEGCETDVAQPSFC